MWIAIVCVAIVVLGLAAFAGLGRMGEMPADPVTDRPRGRIPDGPVTHELLAEARIPVAWTGYDREQVRGYLTQVADGTAGPASGTVFDVVRRGYDMAVVDELMLRAEFERPAAAHATDEPDVPEPPVGGWSDD